MFSRFLRFSLFILLCFLGRTAAAAGDGDKHVLIIGGYSEGEPWMESIINPVMSHLADRADVTCDVQTFNSVLSDSADYVNFTHSLFELYRDDKPGYVVMVGNLTFGMRDEIVSEWGRDLPFLLVSRVLEAASLGEHFAPRSDELHYSQKKMLKSLQKDYNFTSVITPDYYKETVDLMYGAIKDMNELVFFSDSLYVNRYVAHNMRKYVKEQYPDVKFRWVVADKNTSRVMRDYLDKPLPHTGLLLSSWSYGLAGDNGSSMPTHSDLKLVAMSRNPVFSLRSSYFKYGVTGGVYADPEAVERKLIQAVDSMLAGADMSAIPVSVVETYRPIMDFKQMAQYHISEDSCPEGTVIVNKAHTLWEYHSGEMLRYGAVVAAVVALLLLMLVVQHRKIGRFNRSAEFVEVMPIPYASVELRLNDKGSVVSSRIRLHNGAFGQASRDIAEDGTALDFIHPLVEETLRTHKPIRFSHFFEHTGRYFDFLISPVNTRGRHRHHTRMVDVFAREVTESRKAQTAQRELTRKLDMALNASGLVTWRYRVKDDMMEFDRNIALIDSQDFLPVGRKGHRIRLRELIDIVHPDDLFRLLRLHRRLQGGYKGDFSLRLRRQNPSGTTDWVELTGRVSEVDTEGNYTEATGAYRLITDMMAREEERERAFEMAREADRMKSAFISVMSHEIRTPLNAIVGFSNVIAGSTDDPAIQKYCDIIEYNKDQLLTIVDNALEYAKLEANMIDISTAPCDVNHLLGELRDGMSDKVPADVQLNLSYGAENCAILTDKVRLGQVLANLMGNSCKFTTKGSIHVGYELRKIKGEIYFYVRDTGRGLTATERETVFASFTKFDPFVSGTGMGLAICKNLVEKLGGRIGVKSDGRDRGSTFWFTLPYNAAVMPADSGDDGDNDTALPTMLAAGCGAAAVRSLTAMMGGRYRIESANGESDILGKYMTLRPDVVLMDVSDAESAAILDEMRRINDEAPVIAITDGTDPGDEQSAIESGFDVCVCMPLTADALLEALDIVGL